MAESELLTAGQLAERLKVCKRTVLRWNKDGLISGHRIGRKYLRFNEAQVREQMAKNQIKARS